MTIIDHKSLNLEIAVIGAVLADPKSMALCDLEAQEFFDRRNQELWRCMSELSDQGRDAGDPLLIEDVAGKDFQLCGGHARITEIASEIWPSHNLEEYSAKIRELGITRRVMVAVSEASESGKCGEELVSEIVSAAISALGAHASSAMGMPRLIFESLKVLESQDEAISGVATGFEQIDQMLGGLQRGVVTILGGRPSHGKSSLARMIADNVAARGEGVHVFSLEDSAQSYAHRALSQHSNLSVSAIQSGGYQRDADNVFTLKRAAQTLHERKRWLVDDGAGLSSAQISQRARRYQPEIETALIVIDYAQLIGEPLAKGDPKRALDIALPNLVAMARMMNAAVLLLSQLSRNCDNRDDSRPRLSDLRENGRLEQDAHAVLFVYRDEMYGGESGTAEVLIRKNKNGRTGSLKYSWDGKTTSIRPLSSRTA